MNATTLAVGAAIPPQATSKVGFVAWIRRIPGILVVLGVCADALALFLPWLGPDAMESVTGTKYLALPGVALDMMLNAGDYRRRMGLAGLCLLGFAGMIMGVLADTLHPYYLIRMGPSLAIFLFASRLRRPEEITFFIKATLVASLLNPVSQMLSHYGLMNAQYVMATGDERTRLFATTNTASFGYYLVAPAAMLFGLLLPSTATAMHRLVALLIAPVVAGICIFGTVIAQSRSSLTVLVAAPLLVLVVMVGKTSRWARISAVVGLLLAMAVSLPFLDTVFVEMNSFLDRLTRGAAVEDSDAFSGGRTLMVQHFLGDLFTRLPLIPIGPASFEAIFGMPPHIVVGHAYYDGGLLLFGVVLTAFVWCPVQLFRLRFRNLVRPDMEHLFATTVGMFGGLFVQSLTQPALYSRILALLLGLTVAACFALRGESNAPATPR
jgi:hypothetical protein